MMPNAQPHPCPVMWVARLFLICSRLSAIVATHEHESAAT